MYIQNLLEDIKKLKVENKLLEGEKIAFQAQLDTFKKVDYAELSQKLSRFKKIASARLVKEVILDKKNINLTYELSKAENTIISMDEDNQRLPAKPARQERRSRMKAARAPARGASDRSPLPLEKHGEDALEEIGRHAQEREKQTEAPSIIEREERQHRRSD